jgi:hypothetical protein
VEYRFILTYNGTSETLTINPDGWADNGQSWQRDKVYHGVFQSYTVSEYRFSRKKGGGGDFILTAYEAEDIKAVVTVDVYYRNPQTDDFDLTYSGKLNFDPDKFTIDRDFIDIGFVQSGILQKFVTRDELELDINQVVSVDGVTMTAFASAPKNITFKKIDIYRLLETAGNFKNDFYISVSETGPFPLSGTWYQPGGDPIYIVYYASTVTVNELGDSFPATAGPTERAEFLYVNESEGASQVTFDTATRTSGTVKVQVVRYLTATYNETTYFNLLLQVYDADDVLTSQVTIDTQTVIASNDPGLLNPYNVFLSFDFSGLQGDVYNVVPGGKIRLAIKVTTNAASQWYSVSSMQISQQANVTLNVTERLLGQADSSVSCYYPHEAFTRLFQLVTSQENTFYSEILGRTDSEFVTYSGNGTASLTAITTGWNLRQFSGRAFVLSIRDLFDTFNATNNLGMGYDIANQRFYIEKKSDFYDRTKILFDLGEVKELKITAFGDAYYNEVLTGYENKGEYESLSGIKEFQTENSYNADQPVKESLGIRAKYHADSIGMEFARRKPYTNYASEDTDYDDLIYIVRTNGTQTLQGGSNVAGFKGIEQYYNRAITPRENMIRWGNFLKCQYWKEETSFTIRFAKGKKGINISYTNQNGDSVNEFDDIEASELPDARLFNPQYYDFEGTFDSTKLAALQANPHGVIQFTFLGVGYAGFVDEIQTKDYDRVADYKLIAFEATQDVQKIFMDDSEALFMDGDNHLLM